MRYGLLEGVSSRGGNGARTFRHQLSWTFVLVLLRKEQISIFSRKLPKNCFKRQATERYLASKRFVVATQDIYKEGQGEWGNKKNANE